MHLKKQMPAILWAFFIALLCGIPGKDIPSANWLEIISFDKLVHATLFFILNFLGNKAWNENSEQHLKFIISIVCIAYGGLLEILQATVFIDRSADIYDFVANSIGVILLLILTKKTK
jgi:VanZ family protein